MIKIPKWYKCRIMITKISKQIISVILLCCVINIFGNKDVMIIHYLSQLDYFKLSSIYIKVWFMWVKFLHSIYWKICYLNNQNALEKLQEEQMFVTSWR